MAATWMRDIFLLTPIYLLWISGALISIGIGPLRWGPFILGIASGLGAAILMAWRPWRVAMREMLAR